MERIFGTGKFNQMNFLALRGGRLAVALAEDDGVTLRWKTQRKTLRLQRLYFRSAKNAAQKSGPNGKRVGKNTGVYLGL